MDKRDYLRRRIAGKGLYTLGSMKEKYDLSINNKSALYYNTKRRLKILLPTRKSVILTEK